MRSLFLAWQAPNRSWFPIGRLDADRKHYEFGYTKGALQAKKELGFAALPAFPDLNRRYESGELFPLFKNRVLDSNRKDFGEYLETLGLKHDDPIEILALTGGERQTDNFEVFPKVEKREDGSFACRFFLHGLRHVSEAARMRALSLVPGDELGVSLELNNPKTGTAIQLTAREDYLILGWTPHYFVSDLLAAISETTEVTARVVRVNQDNAPRYRRILIEFGGKLPEKFEPMSDKRFQLIVGSQAAAHGRHEKSRGHDRQTDRHRH
jgi:hypothetical protein